MKVREFKQRQNKPALRKKKPKDDHKKLRAPSVEELQQATTVILKATLDGFKSALFPNAPTCESQQEDRQQAAKRKSQLKGTDLFRLDPFTDEHGIYRVGGRLRCAQLEYAEKHPALLPKRHHVSELIVRHYHQKVYHQGRQIAHGAIRQAGYWIVSGNRLVSKEWDEA